MISIKVTSLCLNVLISIFALSYWRIKFLSISLFPLPWMWNIPLWTSNYFIATLFFGWETSCYFRAAVSNLSGSSWRGHYFFTAAHFLQWRAGIYRGIKMRTTFWFMRRLMMIKRGYWLNRTLTMDRF